MQNAIVSGKATIDNDISNYHKDLIKRLYGIDIKGKSVLLGIAEEERSEEKSEKEISDESKLQEYPVNKDNEINESFENEIDTTSCHLSIRDPEFISRFRMSAPDRELY